MKKSNLLLGIIIGLTIFACSSDDNNNSGNRKESKNVFKKASSYENFNLVSFQEVFYNSDQNVTKVITSIDNGWKTTTLDIVYLENKVSKVIKNIEFGDSNNNPNNIDTTREYDVTITNGQITLKGSNNTNDEIQISHTNKFVDIYKTINTSTMNITNEEVFIRNTENNILTHSGVDNMIFNYSDYIDVNLMQFHREYSIDYFIVFDLKISAKLPLTEKVNFQGGNEQTFTLNSQMLTLDNNNNVLKNGDNINYIQYEYLSL